MRYFSKNRKTWGFFAEEIKYKNVTLRTAHRESQCGVSFQSRFLLEPPTAPSFVVVVELNSWSAVTSLRTASLREEPTGALEGPIKWALRAVTNPRDSLLPLLRKKKGTWLDKALSWVRLSCVSFPQNKLMLHNRADIRVQPLGFLFSNRSSTPLESSDLQFY